MIVGLGSDLCNIERIQASLDRFGARFEQRVFTETERAKADRRPFTKAGTLAKRFAASLRANTASYGSCGLCSQSARANSRARNELANRLRVFSSRSFRRVKFSG